MSSKIILFFGRLLDVIEQEFNSGAQFSDMAGFNRQNISNYRRKYYCNLPKDHPDYRESKDGEDVSKPNLKLDTLLPMIEVIINETNISLYWLFTGSGEREVNSVQGQLAAQAVDLNEKSEVLQNTGQIQDLIVEYLLKNRNEVQNFLDTLPSR